MKGEWRRKRLGEIIKLEYGKPLPDLDRKPFGLYPVYGANGEKTRSDKFFFDKPSIIVGRKGSAGEINFTEDKFWPLDVTYFVTFDEQSSDLRFIYHLLSSLDLQNLAKGVKPGINRNDVCALSVAIPALCEQKRIVGILDEAFDGITAAKANAEKNLQNARAIFESHLQSVFSQRGKGWAEVGKPLSSLCSLIVDCEHKTAPTQDTGIPSIRTPNIGKGRLLLEGVNLVSDETYKAWTRRAEPAAGDLIFSREAPAGNVAVIPEETRLCLGQRTVLIRPNREIVDSTFLAYLLLEPDMQERLLGHSRGATVQHVNMKDIRALDIGAIPPVEVQRHIALQAEGIASEGDRLASIYERKLTALDALKKSLLNAAFTGQL